MIFRRKTEHVVSGSLATSGQPRKEPHRPDPKSRREMIDAAFTSYVEWRAECGMVDNAYRGWQRADAADAAAAYVGYRAALDREQAAADRYAGLMRKADHLVESGLDHPLDAVGLIAEGRRPNGR